MAISAPAKSAQYTNYAAGNLVAGYDWGSRLRVSYAKLTFTAAGYTSASSGDIFLLRLPPGFVRVFNWLSWVYCPAGTSTSDLDIGYSAYTDYLGAAQVADENNFADSLDVGGGVIAQVLVLPANKVVEFNSRSGVDVVCSFDTANSPASGSMEIAMVYQQGR